MTVLTQDSAWIVEVLGANRNILGVWNSPESASRDNPEFEWGSPYKDGSRISRNMRYIITPWVINA